MTNLDAYPTDEELDAHYAEQLATFTPDEIDMVFGIGPFPAKDEGDC